MRLIDWLFPIKYELWGDQPYYMHKDDLELISKHRFSYSAQLAMDHYVNHTRRGHGYAEIKRVAK